jgi:peptidoglycan/xylan/chitin deacetylase (PgdA/CDA1 family)
MSGFPYLAAVVPAELDDDGRQWLASNPEGMTIAMHGVTHRRMPPGADSEFAGRGREECFDMIESGKRMLGVMTNHFVAPFNYYGEHLHAVLCENDICVHWTGPTVADVPSPPEDNGDYVAVPAWRPLYGALLWPSGTYERPLCEAMPELMEMQGRAVLTLHLTWEAARGEEFEGVRWLVERYGDRVISLEEYFR